MAEVTPEEQLQQAPGLAMPNINPFLQPDKAKSSADWQSNRWDEATFRAEAVRGRPWS